MNKNEIIERITKQLDSLVKYEVSLLGDTDTIFKEKYENLVDQIGYALEEARALVDNFKKEKLKFNSVESEGYLRAMLTIKHLTED